MLKPFLISARLALLVVAVGAAAADAPPDAAWVNVSDPVVRKLRDEGKEFGYPGETAGVVVDPKTGDVYMIVAGLGVWKSSDRAATFARADAGEIGGRCETGYSLNVDPAGGGRLACFMLDGKCAMTLNGGKTWRPFADVGRNWDYAAVDWSKPEPTTIFAALHESGGQYFLSNDAGKTWRKLGEDPVFDKIGGVGVFDDKTLVMTRGDGILRSADAGSTWTKVSNLTPTGRVMCAYNGTAYWLGKEGLLLSKDNGVTWQARGKPVEATLGPWFKDDNHLTAAGPRGIYESADAGATWRLIAPLPEGFGLPKAGWFSNVAWDPANDMFYASQMGKPTFRWERRR